MNEVLYAGNAQSNDHRAKITFSSPLQGDHTKYAFLVTASGATLARLGAHVIGFDMDQTNQNVAAFEVYTDLPIAQFSWIVVRLAPSAEQCVGTIADLRALPAGMVPCLTVLGYNAPGDGGGGTFYWDASATEPDNAGTIFVPGSNPLIGRWKRLGAEQACDIHVRWFGAKGKLIAADNDPNEDDTDAIRKAIDFSNQTGRNASVVFGAGIFRYSDTVWIPFQPDPMDPNKKDPHNKGITLIGSRDAAAQQGSARPATVLRWTGGAVPTFTIASTFTSFKDMAVENVGSATYFAEVEPPQAGRLKFYGVSCQAGASGPTSKPFSRGFLKLPVTDYSRIERCEFAGAAPVIVDMDGTQLSTGGTTTFYFVDNVVDTSFDTDVFRLTNCPFELLKIVNNTFNAQANAYDPNDNFYSKLGLIYAGSGLTVVNSTAIDKDHVDATGYELGNLVFKDNEYDDSAYDFSDDPSKFPHLDDKPPTLSPDEIKRLRGELQRLAGVRMLKLRHTRNLDLENNNIEGNGANEALVEMTNSVAYVGQNVAVSIGALVKTLDDASRVFFEHNNMGWGRVKGLLNSGSNAGIVKMWPNIVKGLELTVPIFGQLGDPRGMTTYQFDPPDNQDYTIYVAQPGDSHQLFGYMTRGQKVLVVVRNILDGAMGIIKFSQAQFNDPQLNDPNVKDPIFKMTVPFPSPGPRMNRAILFECYDVHDHNVTSDNGKTVPVTIAYMVERWRGAAEVPN